MTDDLKTLKDVTQKLQETGIPYMELKFSRRKLRDLGGFDGYIISPEDLVLSKLLWAKDSMSEMQFRDVKNILSSCSNLDKDYLNKWASVLSVDDLLQNCLSGR